MNRPRTLFQKIWDRHVIDQNKDGSSRLSSGEVPAILYIDLHLVHEVTSPQAFTGLRQRQLKVRRTDKTVATIDHSVPTRPAAGHAEGRMAYADPQGRSQVHQLEENCREFGVSLMGLDSPLQGIVHVIGPELGLTQPGMTIVCGDSHTATHGALGALAFGIGTSEVEHVLATQCLLQYQPKTCEVRIDGHLDPGVSAKDVILAVIAKMGVGGGKGCVIEYTGQAVLAMDMEQRMTVCNMSIEAGARAGMVAPDEITFNYLAGRQYAPKGPDWDTSLTAWRKLLSDEGATYNKIVSLDASTLEPMITYGTNPGMALPVTGRIPLPEAVVDSAQRDAYLRALQYMDLHPGDPILGHPVDVVFIGSCTNGRISDLRLAANLIKGRKVAPGLRVLVVPGSQQVKAQANAEGLDVIFKEAGAEWREPGCSMCIGMNGDQLEPGQYSISTSNRNFEGRQGKGGRTFLASPLMAAAAALSGCITDVRNLLP